MKNTHGGGAKTNLNGLRFEQETNICEALEKENFKVSERDNNNEFNVYLEDKLIGYVLKKHGFYTFFGLKEEEDGKQCWEKYISKQLLPDDVFFNIKKKTLYIIEKKFQNDAGSVDEKLQTFQFKIYEYKKLMPKLRKKGARKIKFYYVTNEFFDDPKYDDIKKYIKIKGSDIFKNKIPNDKLGLKF